ncbi:hypothetical protein H0H87_011473 [Tephrocybe sp. NHM501043]|nr:hypothetical protein H0H87_011473 [Tephrocybe sp. NHM501043]
MPILRERIAEPVRLTAVAPLAVTARAMSLLFSRKQAFKPAGEALSRFSFVVSGFIDRDGGMNEMLNGLNNVVDMMDYIFFDHGALVNGGVFGFEMFLAEDN